MSKPPKIDRKELRHPDQFQKKGAVFLELLLANRNHLIFLLAGILVLVIGAYGYSLWDEHRVETAWNVFHDASKANEKDKWALYQKVYSDHKGTRAALFAASALADFYFEEARKGVLKDPKVQPPETNLAIEWYAKALEFPGLLPQEKQLLSINLGNANELAGKYDEALKLYQSAQEGGGQIKGYALINVARIYELKNDKAKAIETYEKVAADFINTEYSKIAKNNVRRLKNPTLSTQNL